jgi:hypothetical protein
MLFDKELDAIHYPIIGKICRIYDSRWGLSAIRDGLQYVKIEFQP